MVNDDYQASCFKCVIEMHPSFPYVNNVLVLVDNYKAKKIKYSKKQFSNFNNLKKEILNAEIYKE